MTDTTDAIRQFTEMEDVDALQPVKTLTKHIKKRPSWDQYFMSIAEQVATRATCDRKHVGCVLVAGRQIIATGYNGSVKGEAHCDDVGHHMVEGHCVRTLHAEVNALTQAAKKGIATKGAAAYVTALPCWPCFRALANAGIAKIFFSEYYRAEETLETYAAVCKGGKHKTMNNWEYARVVIVHQGRKPGTATPWGGGMG
jgi:dCMP deaminase